VEQQNKEKDRIKVDEKCSGLLDRFVVVQLQAPKLLIVAMSV